MDDRHPWLAHSDRPGRRFMATSLGMSSVVVAVTGRCAAAAADTASLGLTPSGIVVTPSQKLWAGDQVLGAVVGAVSFQSVDVLDLMRTALAANPGHVRAAAQAVRDDLLRIGPCLASAASAHRLALDSTETAALCTTVMLVGPIAGGFEIIVSGVTWTGRLNSTVTTFKPSDPPMLAAMGAPIAAADLNEAQAQLTAAAKLNARNIDALASAAVDVALERVHAVALSPPRINGHPTVTLPIQWALLKPPGGMQGQVAPSAIVDLSP
jgi:hypothetical protein